MMLAADERWTTKQACIVTGCTPRQLHHWRNQGYVSSDLLQMGNGRFRWSFDNLMHATVLHGFLDGSKGHRIPALAARLAVLPLDTFDFVTIAPAVTVGTAEQVAQLAANHAVTVLPLAHLRARLSRGLAALKAQP